MIPPTAVWPDTTIHVSLEVAAPVEALWLLVGDFAGLMRWNPLLVRCTTEGLGIGAVRTAYFPGHWIAERLEERDDAAHVIAYSMPDSSLKELVGWRASISLAALSKDRTRLDWRSAPPNGTFISRQDRLARESYFRQRVGHLEAAANSLLD